MPLTLAIIRRRRMLRGNLSFSIAITGLTGGIAEVGDHASIGYTINPDSGTETVKWSNSATSADAATYGTGAAPTDYAAGDGGTLYLHVTDGGDTITASAPIQYAAAVNTVAPVASGTPNVGELLSATNGTWTAAGGSYGYQWQRDGVDISGATSSTYTAVSADAGTDVRCVVTYTNSGGSISANSNALSITDVPAQFGAGDWSVADKSSAQAGETVTVTISALPDDGGTAITDIEYQVDSGAWTSSGTSTTGSFDISGLTNDTQVAIGIRAVNATGNGTGSAAKNVTPTDTAVPSLGGGGYDGTDTVSITVNEPGTVRVRVDDNATRTAAQVIATGALAYDTAVVSASGDFVVDLSAANDGGNHYVHIAYIDENGNLCADVDVISAQYAFPSADVTAPTLSSPTDAADGATTSTWSVTTDEGNGTLYWVITQSATGPGAAQVKAGQDHLGAAAGDSGSQAVSATGAQNGSGSGLTASTGYYTHFMHEDSSTNQSTVSTASGFTTDAADVTAPTFSSGSPADDATGVAVAANLVLTFDETIVGATAGGEFYLYATAGPTLIETFDVDAGTGDNGGTISVSGTDVTINPGADLSNSTGYSVRWNAGAVEDASGNGVAANTGDTLYNFTTAAAGLTPVTFDGTDDYLSRSTALTGGATNAQFTLYWKGAANDTIAAGNSTIVSGTTTRFHLSIPNNNVFLRGKNGSNTKVLELSTTTGVGSYDDGTTNEVMISVDLSTGAPSYQVYINGSSVAMTENTLTGSEVIDFGIADWAIGAEVGGTVLFGGSMTRLAIFTGVALDLSVAGNRTTLADETDHASVGGTRILDWYSGANQAGTGAFTSNGGVV